MPGIDVVWRLRLEDVLCRLARLMLERGVPEHIRSDNGPEFIGDRRCASGSAASARRRCSSSPARPRENGIRRVVQRQATRRAAQRRDLLHAARGSSRHRGVATRVQPHPPAQLIGLPPTRTRSTTARRGRLRFAPPAPAGACAAERGEISITPFPARGQTCELARPSGADHWDDAPSQDDPHHLGARQATFSFTVAPAECFPAARITVALDEAASIESAARRFRLFCRVVEGHHPGDTLRRRQDPGHGQRTGTGCPASA